MPIVTTSSHPVGETLSDLMKAIAGLLAGVDDTASQIHASDGSYGQVDNHAEDGIRRSWEGGH
jgi:hypothetical protein